MATFSSRILHFSDSHFRNKNIRVDFIVIHHFLSHHPLYYTITLQMLLTVMGKCIVDGFFSYIPSSPMGASSFSSPFSSLPLKTTPNLSKAVILKSNWAPNHLLWSPRKTRRQSSDQRLGNVYFLQSSQVSLMCSLS